MPAPRLRASPPVGQSAPPITIADAALLMLPHKRLLTDEEPAILLHALAEGRCATAGQQARLQGAYARLRLLELVP